MKNKSKKYIVEDENGVSDVIHQSVKEANVWAKQSIDEGSEVAVVYEITPLHSFKMVPTLVKN